MFELHCHACGQDHIVGPRSIRSFHNTADGPVAYVRCPRGHDLVRSFRDARGAAPVAAVG